MRSHPSRDCAETLTAYALSNPPVGNARIGAALTLGKKIVSFGHNQLKSHPLQRRFGRNEQSIYLHAEIDAIKNALKHVHVDLLPHTCLHVVRVKRAHPRGDYCFGLAKPCLGCMRAIATFGIRQVYYSVEPNGIARL